MLETSYLEISPNSFSISSYQSYKKFFVLFLYYLYLFFYTNWLHPFVQSPNWEYLLSRLFVFNSDWTCYSFHQTVPLIFVTDCYVPCPIVQDIWRWLKGFWRSSLCRILVPMQVQTRTNPYCLGGRHEWEYKDSSILRWRHADPYPTQW